ncbi:MAG: hypothetical protein CL416_07905 [Acidimicrobiaceae bacterium]|nr:hypothetical protein [Acidimicrobiaceae bacterium]
MLAVALQVITMYMLALVSSQEEVCRLVLGRKPKAGERRFWEEAVDLILLILLQQTINRGRVDRVLFTFKL